LGKLTTTGRCALKEQHTLRRGRVFIFIFLLENVNENIAKAGLKPRHDNGGCAVCIWG
jgi:hypothetical protein